MIWNLNVITKGQYTGHNFSLKAADTLKSWELPGLDKNPRPVC